MPLQAQQEPPVPRPSRNFRIGERPADFTLPDAGGTRIQLKELRGKVVVLNFWFIHCRPCVREMPDLNALTAEFSDTSKVVFLAIALDEGRQIDSFIQKHPFNYTILPKGRPVSVLYNIYQYPTHAVLNTDGRVIFHSTGYSTGTAYWLRKNILAGLPK